MKYKGINLLNAVLEFIAMTPEEYKWSLSNLKSNPPRYIRLQRINSLINAFFNPRNYTGGTSVRNIISIRSIISGDFIDYRDVEEYSELIEQMYTTIGFSREEEEEDKDESSFNTYKLKTIYKSLFQYNTKLRELLLTNSDVIEASSVEFLYPIYLTNKVSKNISKNISELNDALEMFINPLGHEYEHDELVANFAYPTADLDDIDLEYW